MTTTSDLIEALTATLERWRSLCPEGATIDQFARQEIARKWRAGETDGQEPADRVSWANREYARLYMLSLELAFRFLLKATLPEQGKPTVFVPVAPWFTTTNTTKEP